MPDTKLVKLLDDLTSHIAYTNGYLMGMRQLEPESLHTQHRGEMLERGRTLVARVIQYAKEEANASDI